MKTRVRTLLNTMANYGSFAVSIVLIFFVMLYLLVVFTGLFVALAREGAWG